MSRSALDGIAARIRENVRAIPPGQIDVPGSRAVFDAMGQVTQLVPDTRVEPLSGVRGEVITPPNAEGDRRVLYFHGGAYALGSLEGYRAMLSHVAAACRAPIWSMEYRLAPEHPFPAAVDDANEAWRFALAKPAGKTVMMGDSAGGNLTLSTLIRAKAEKIAMPQSAVLISPWLDLDHVGASMKSNAEADPLVREQDSRAYAALYMSGVSARDPRVSPLYADLAGLPPLYVQVGKDEALYDDSTRLAERARAAGTDIQLDTFDGVFHVWHFFAGIAPEADDAIARIGAFVRA